MGTRGPLPVTGKGEPAAPVTIKRPPGMPREAGMIWDHLARHLAIARRLRPEDLLALETLCRHAALLRKVLRKLERSPLVSKLKNGTVAIDQHFKALAELQKQVERGVRHFGLSPAARGAIMADDPDADGEEFDDFLGSRPEVRSPL